ncbi:cytoplasmic protein [Listeria newyorkensis]|uniref:Cytoplasmic protein n=1 Tax=Listeria newyorkensis TaxID=1497681 RepID=A0A841YY55_9LIST|nr:cytoplasmic protein [Listeria newyorkensis]
MKHFRRLNLISLKAAHKFASNNKIWLAKADRCSCFYCLALFEPSEITEWLEIEDTALCPYCMIDSVLPELDILPLSREFLNDMHQQWFG